MKQTIVRGKHAYRLAGHFSDLQAAVKYKNQTLHSIIVAKDEPTLGKRIRYHVYRRLT